MILPPFFGFINKRDTSELEQILLSYLSIDAVSYTIPTEKINLSYLAADVISYNKKLPIINLTYVSSDVLSYNTLKEENRISYIAADVLVYNLPPTPPGLIEYIFAREKDSLGIFKWPKPFDGKSPIIDYLVEYSDDSGASWNTYYDGTSTNTGLNISITNNIPYQIRVAAINNIGTGLFTTSDIIIPSGGIDNDNDLLFFANMDQADRNQIVDYSCLINQIDTIENVEPNISDGSWYFPGDVSYSEESFITETYPHMRVYNPDGLYNTLWSLSGNFTISVWFKPDSIVDSQNRTLLSSCSEYDGNDNVWQLYHNNQNIYFNINGANILSSSPVLATNSYNNITICRSRNYISLFFDGIGQQEIYYPNNIIINNPYLIIGALHSQDYNFDNLYSRGYVTQGFSGYIDDIIVSRSAFYRKNFTVVKKSPLSIDCG
jgi:hypothetical protein